MHFNIETVHREKRKKINYWCALGAIRWLPCRSPPQVVSRDIPRYPHSLVSPISNSNLTNWWVFIRVELFIWNSKPW